MVLIKQSEHILSICAVSGEENALPNQLSDLLKFQIAALSHFTKHIILVNPASET